MVTAMQRISAFPTPRLFVEDPSKLATLKARYAEPHRCYHDWRHVGFMLGEFSAAEGAFAAPEAALYAIYYHDAVYRADCDANEEESAALWREDARGVVGKELIELVAAYILATKTHAVDDALPKAARGDCALFLDIDLAIFGAGDAEYDAYAQGVRAEFASIPEAHFKAGRARALEAFLDRPSIYLTAPYRARLEKKARRNIAREIASLHAGDSGISE